jgi:hypothetical protein
MTDKALRTAAARMVAALWYEDELRSYVLRNDSVLADLRAAIAEPEEPLETSEGPCPICGHAESDHGTTYAKGVVGPECPPPSQETAGPEKETK